MIATFLPLILSKQQSGRNGSKHGGFFKDKLGHLFYVFHTHNSPGKVAKRKTALLKAFF